MSDDTMDLPAFPQHSWQRIDKIEVGECLPGMTLRDYFASAALATVLYGNAHVNYDSLAEVSYQIADAMMSARIKE